ncbi:MAG: hypothetical protein M5U34_00850 [Chloroflexi bacterium]|nr:hypothetical protein [Chloroflexota bacterium]
MPASCCPSLWALTLWAQSSSSARPTTQTLAQRHAVGPQIIANQTATALNNAQLAAESRRSSKPNSAP